MPVVNDPALPRCKSVLVRLLCETAAPIVPFCTVFSLA